MGEAPHLPVAEQEMLLHSREGVQCSRSHHAAVLCCVHTLHALLSGKGELNKNMSVSFGGCFHPKCITVSLLPKCIAGSSINTLNKIRLFPIHRANDDDRAFEMIEDLFLWDDLNFTCAVQ